MNRQRRKRLEKSYDRSMRLWKSYRKLWMKSRRHTTIFRRISKMENEGRKCQDVLKCWKKRVGISMIQNLSWNRFRENGTSAEILCVLKRSFLGRNLKQGSTLVKWHSYICILSQNPFQNQFPICYTLLGH